MTIWKRTHGNVLRRGRSRLTSVALTVAPDSMRSRTHPSCPNCEAAIRAVEPYSWTHTRAILKGQRGMGEHGARRAAGLWGIWRRVGRARRGHRRQRRRRRGHPREAHAAAHLRIVPVDVSSKLDQPPELRLVAVLCGLPQWFFFGRTKPAHVFSALSAAREGRPTSSLTRNRSETVRLPSPQRCEACRAPRGCFEANGRAQGSSWPQGPIPCSTRAASRPAPELAARASAHAQKSGSRCMSCRRAWKSASISAPRQPRAKGEWTGAQLRPMEMWVLHAGPSS